MACAGSIQTSVKALSGAVLGHCQVFKEATFGSTRYNPSRAAPRLRLAPSYSMSNLWSGQCMRSLHDAIMPSCLSGGPSRTIQWCLVVGPWRWSSLSICGNTQGPFPENISCCWSIHQGLGNYPMPVVWQCWLSCHKHPQHAAGSACSGGNVVWSRYQQQGHCWQFWGFHVGASYGLDQCPDCSLWSYVSYHVHRWNHQEPRSQWTLLQLPAGAEVMATFTERHPNLPTTGWQSGCSMPLPSLSCLG